VFNRVTAYGILAYRFGLLPCFCLPARGRWRTVSCLVHTRRRTILNDMAHPDRPKTLPIGASRRKEASQTIVKEVAMSTSVLVGYATTYGSTQEVAGRSRRRCVNAGWWYAQPMREVHSQGIAQSCWGAVMFHGTRTRLTGAVPQSFTDAPWLPACSDPYDEQEWQDRGSTRLSAASTGLNRSHWKCLAAGSRLSCASRSICWPVRMAVTCGLASIHAWASSWLLLEPALPKSSDFCSRAARIYHCPVCAQGRVERD
jgi:hypothetical protein